MVLGLLVGTRFQVLFHSPRRGAFHLSLTVLVHYRSPTVFSLGRWTSQFRTGLACPVLLRCSMQVRSVPLRDSHPLRSGSPADSSPKRFFPLLPCGSRVLQPPPGYRWVWAAPRSLATTSGILSSPQDTWMFRFSWCPSLNL